MHVSLSMRDTVLFQLENRLLRLFPTSSTLRIYSPKKTNPLSIQLVLGVESSLYIDHFLQMLYTFINSILQLHKVPRFVVNSSNFYIHLGELGAHILKASVFLINLSIDFETVKLIHLVALMFEL